MQTSQELRFPSGRNEDAQQVNVILELYNFKKLQIKAYASQPII